MVDFIIDTWWIWLATILAGLSFLLINLYAQKKAKESELNISKTIDSAVQKSVDETIGKMQLQFEEVIDSLKTNSEKNMRAINTQGETIIANLSKKSQEASDVIQQSISKIENDTEILGNSLLYRSAVLVVTFKFDTNAQQGVDVIKVNELFGVFLNKFTSSFKIIMDEGRLNFETDPSDFKYTQKYGAERFSNSYHHSYQNCATVGEDADIIRHEVMVNFKLEATQRTGKISIQKGKTANLVLDPKGEFVRKREIFSNDFEKNLNITCSEGLLIINGKEYQLNFQQLLPNFVENRTIQIFKFKID